MAENAGFGGRRLTTSNINRRYIVFFLLLLTLVVGAVLGASGYLVLQGATRLQQDLQDFFEAEESTRQEEALRATAVYLRSRLFNPLYSLNIEKLNEEIAQVCAWLPVSRFLVSDRTGRILSDGTPENRLYGATLALPMSGSTEEEPIIRPTSEGLELFFVISYGEVIAGFANVKLSNASLEMSLHRLNAASNQSWQDYRQGLTRLAIAAVLTIVLLGSLLSVLLSRILARPLAPMAKAAHKYVEGRREPALPVQSNDELDQLALTLNKLAQNLRNSHELLDQAQRIARLGSWSWQPGRPELHWSAEVYRIFGAHPLAFTPTVDEMLGFIRFDQRDQIRKYFTLPLHETRFQQETTLVCPGGEERIVLLQGEASDTEVSGKRWVGTIQDITERKHAEGQMAYLANYDALTGLPNRYLFQDRLEHALSQADRSGEQLALLFLDLDRFKAINDTFGHDVGDELLKKAARRLMDTVRNSDTVARLGGDEFILLLENVIDSEEVSHVAGKVLARMNQPFHLSGRDLFVSASIGIALYPGDASDVHTLLKHADTAMYQAKEQGRAAYRFFTSELNQQVQAHLLLETALRHALERGEFALHFQPQAQLDDGRIIGVEALLRWQPAQSDPISPADFIPILEDTGLILAVGEWVLREACGWLKRWEQAGLPMPRVAVNLSARQLQQGALVRIIADILASHELAAERLELEITESILVEQATSAPAITELQAMGVRWAIDDFGTGYCSLSYLKRFAVDTLKIDRSFVRDVATDSDDAAITAAIITLAHNLELTVVAEGVESVEQVMFLRHHDCDSLQGFLASPPLPPEACEAWLRQQTVQDGALFWRAPANTCSYEGGSSATCSVGIAG
ncbi:MAG: EAL domain-containing protein [Candidatus Competibacteraceae bacterium]|nr:EAL domain-containing protein [Candidatus Competibacteraceae bacterium]MCP5124950.1 EAL domain-containing protein [Gammaproteobacteria bacterium]HRX69897.1 EAL domain-containing protein [Candidatus Competibacteraceae bacterium]